MTNQDIMNSLAVFSSLYTKRFLEGNFYDKILDTQLGKKIKSLDKKGKYAIEFGLNLLTVFFDQKLAGDTALKRFVKEVGIDASPEISARLISSAEDSNSPEQKDLVKMLLQLDEKALVELLNGLYDMNQKERTKILKHISTLSFDELGKLARVTSANIEKIIGLIEPQIEDKKIGPLLSPKMVEDIQKTTAKIEKMRKEFREKREER